MYMVKSVKSVNMGGERVTVAVFVEADNKAMALFAATQKFKNQIEDHDTTFDELQGLSKKELSEVYEADACLEALHLGAQGSCIILEKPNTSDVTYCLWE